MLPLELALARSHSNFAVDMRGSGRTVNFSCLNHFCDNEGHLAPWVCAWELRLGLYVLLLWVGLLSCHHPYLTCLPLIFANCQMPVGRIRHSELEYKPDKVGSGTFAEVGVFLCGRLGKRMRLICAIFEKALERLFVMTLHR